MDVLNIQKQMLLKWTKSNELTLDKYKDLDKL